jgi:hypothetical protein
MGSCSRLLAIWAQVRANGWVSTTFGQGWIVESGGVTVASSGLTVLSGGIQADGSVIMASGTVSIASPHAASGLAVEAAVSSFTGNTILGRIPQGSPSVALKLERGSPLFTVCWGIVVS